jgi:putative ABC transport system substrate-binding protein
VKVAVTAPTGAPVRRGRAARSAQSKCHWRHSLNTELIGKRLELLRRLVPRATTFCFLAGDATYILNELQMQTMLAAAHALGLKLTIVECRKDRDFDAALATFAQRGVDAVILGGFPLGNFNKVLDLAAQHTTPTMYP